MSSTAQFDGGIHVSDAEAPAAKRRLPLLNHVQQHLERIRKRKLDPQLQRDLTAGWLLPYLLAADDLLWHRWDHWARTLMAGKVLDEPIPHVSWGAHDAARKMWERTLDAVTPHGGWQGWSGWENMNYALDWLLFGFGHHGYRELPKEPHPGASMRLYQTFCLEAAMAYPYDYLGDMLAENAHGKHLGFYPTPMCLTEMMAAMLFHDEEDARTKSVNDPCLGTGRMLLVASNHSYRLYGMDIDLTVIKAALINGYLYAPWLVRPFPFLDRDLADPSCSAKLADHMHKSCARPDVAAHLGGTLHDSDLQPKAEPIKIRRRRRDDEQCELALF